DEALELRRNGIDSPILVLGYTAPEYVQTALMYDISLTVYTEEVLKRIGSVYKNKQANIHIKLDTGMGRIGIHNTQEAIQFIQKAIKMRAVKVEGLYTHYACADEKDKSYTYEQHEKFMRIIDHFAAQGHTFPLNHAGNSATAIE